MRIERARSDVFVNVASSVLMGQTFEIYDNASAIPAGIYMKIGQPYNMHIPVDRIPAVDLSNGVVVEVPARMLVTPLDVHVSVDGVAGGLTANDTYVTSDSSLRPGDVIPAVAPTRMAVNLPSHATGFGTTVTGGFTQPSSLQGWTDEFPTTVGEATAPRLSFESDFI